MPLKSFLTLVLFCANLALPLGAAAQAAAEFRDGNVPALMAPLTVAKAAFAALPCTVRSYYYRGDSACHEKELLHWLLDEKRAGGPQGFIGFAISVAAGNGDRGNRWVPGRGSTSASSHLNL